MKQLFVWDFHGVLEKNNVHAVVEYCNLTLVKFDIDKKVSVQEATEWYGLSWYDYFKLATPRQNHKTWQEMVKNVLAIQQRNWHVVEKHIKVQNHANKILEDIIKNKDTNILISNTNSKRIIKFTDLIKITNSFSNILGVNTHFKSRKTKNKNVGNIKTDILKRYLKNKNFSKIIAIGDKESDITAGRLCGAVTYLFTDPALLQKPIKSSADFMISDLREIRRELVQ